MQQGQQRPALTGSGAPGRLRPTELPGPDLPSSPRRRRRGSSSCLAGTRGDPRQTFVKRADDEGRSRWRNLEQPRGRRDQADRPHRNSTVAPVDRRRELAGQRRSVGVDKRTDHRRRDTGPGDEIDRAGNRCESQQPSSFHLLERHSAPEKSAGPGSRRRPTVRVGPPRLTWNSFANFRGSRWKIQIGKIKMQGGIECFAPVHFCRFPASMLQGIPSPLLRNETWSRCQTRRF